MRDKRGNFGLISGVLLPYFTLNYMLIRVKERRKEQEGRERNDQEEEENIKAWEIAC